MRHGFLVSDFWNWCDGGELEREVECRGAPCIHFKYFNLYKVLAPPTNDCCLQKQNATCRMQTPNAAHYTHQDIAGGD